MKKAIEGHIVKLTINPNNIIFILQIAPTTSRTTPKQIVSHRGQETLYEQIRVQRSSFLFLLLISSLLIFQISIG